jgi:outer membrane protein OmpA-like peptidoglycan-associated protein
MDVAPKYICADCMVPLEAVGGLTAIPGTCPDCRSPSLGWRDSRSGRWSEQIEREDARGQKWIKGRFDTNYTGELTSPLETALASRTYRIAMRDSRLWELQRVAEPPALVALEGHVPLQFDRLGPVTIAHRDAEVGPERMYSLDLYDVRLHEWGHASIDGEDADAAGLVGRLWGTVYARLTTPAPTPMPTTSPKSAPNAPATHDAGSPVAPAAPVASARFASEPARPLERVRTGFWQSLGAFWRRHQPPGFLSVRACLGLVLLFLFLLLTCRLPAMVGVLVLFALSRLIARARLPSRMRAVPFGVAGRAMPLIALAVGCWAFGRIAEGVGACQGPPPGACILLAVLLLGCAWFRFRLAAAVTAALILLALVVVFQLESTRCRVTVAQDLPKAPQQNEAPAPAPATASAAASRTSSRTDARQPPADEGHRISIEQALSDPHRYFDCSVMQPLGAQPYEIYLGESALFDFKQARFGVLPDDLLQKVASLIKTNPTAHIVLTGYSDKTGVSLLNQKLSEQRAQGVADWLVGNGVLASNKIDVQGAGDRRPVVDDPALFRLNRRVELRIDCAR